MYRRRWRSRPIRTKNGRWISRRPRAGSRRKKLWFILLVFFLLSVQSFIFVERNLKPPLMNLAKIRLKQIATQSINTAIADQLSRSANLDKLIDWKTDHSGKVTAAVWNYAEHMRITSDTINRVQSLLDNIKEIPEHVPLGMAMNSAIFASFGPDIPVRLTPAGAVKVDLSTRYQNAGINMVLVEVYIRIMAEVTIIIPFDAAPEIVETELPVSYVLLVGDTPLYYMDNKGNPVGGSGPLPPGVNLPNVKISPHTPSGQPQDAEPGQEAGIEGDEAPVPAAGTEGASPE